MEQKKNVCVEIDSKKGEEQLIGAVLRLFYNLIPVGLFFVSGRPMFRLPDPFL